MVCLQGLLPVSGQVLLQVALLCSTHPDVGNLVSTIYVLTNKETRRMTGLESSQYAERQNEMAYLAR